MEDMNTLQRLQRFAERERAPVVIHHKPGEGWSLMSEFGQEAPDSPMAGGAIYGMDEDVTTCIEQGLADAGYGPDGRRV